ncbi:hypothetical protein V8C43DRAFT_282488 [Trichoderma afarasin]
MQWMALGSFVQTLATEGQAFSFDDLTKGGLREQAAGEEGRVNWSILEYRRVYCAKSGWMIQLWTFHQVSVPHRLE